MKEERCPFLRSKGEGDYKCSETEKPSGRIHPCPKEYGGECLIPEQTIGDILIETAREVRK